MIHIPTTIEPPSWMYDVGFFVFQTSGVFVTDSALMAMMLCIPAIAYLWRN